MKYLLNLIIVGMLLSACSASLPKGYIPETGVLKIDKLVSKEKEAYFEECYKIFLDAGVPENECQSNLFNILDRRHGVRFNKKQLANVADEYFFTSLVYKKIHRLIRSDSKVRLEVRNKFKSMKDLTDYYQTQYSFHKDN